MQFPTLLLALLPLTLSLPSTPHQTHNFTLKSHVLSPPNPALENLYLGPYHIHPAFNYGTLDAPTAQNRGIVGYLNGTKEELQTATGELLFYGGAGFAYGFVIDSVNTTYNPVEINARAGTKGIYIDQGFIKYHNPMSGGFYACNKTLLYGPAVQVFYKPKVMKTPVGCSDVELVVEYC